MGSESYSVGDCVAHLELRLEFPRFILPLLLLGQSQDLVLLEEARIATHFKFLSEFPDLIFFLLVFKLHSPLRLLLRSQCYSARGANITTHLEFLLSLFLFLLAFEFFLPLRWSQNGALSKRGPRRALSLSSSSLASCSFLSRSSSICLFSS